MNDPTTITPDPDRDGVLIHLPEITYLDTQPGAVDIGLPTSSLAALRAALDEPGPDREQRIPLDDLTSNDLDQLYGDLDRYEEVLGDLNETLVHRAKRAGRAEAALTRVRAACDQLHRAAVLADGQPHSDRERGIVQAVTRVRAALDQPVPAATGVTEPHTGLIVQPYRNDRHEDVWVFRCWGTATCDGHLSLDHHTRQSAERARDRHIAENHAEQTAAASQETGSEVQQLRAALDQIRALREDLAGITGARWIAAALDHILDPAPVPAIHAPRPTIPHPDEQRERAETDMLTVHPPTATDLVGLITDTIPEDPR